MVASPTGRSKACFGGSAIRRLAKINAWNRERRLEQTTSDTVEFDAITTGNFGGFDVWLDESTEAAMLNIRPTTATCNCRWPTSAWRT
ncbi:MAG: hypothetical protein R3E68_02590 [Burkholderiaceae bacterium]